MASLKFEISLKKKTHPENKYSVTFVSKVGTKLKLVILKLMCKPALVFRLSIRSNGIFVRGGFFFSSDKFRLFN